MDTSAALGVAIVGLPVASGWLWVAARRHRPETSIHTVKDFSSLIHLSESAVRGIRRALPLLLTSATAFFAIAVITNLGPATWETEPMWRTLAWVATIGMAAPLPLAISVFSANKPVSLVALRHRAEPGYFADIRVEKAGWGRDDPPEPTGRRERRRR